mmetsp:Transcript_15982/g.47445  ORF Transcript_15982/g.47445 Transcript_15982/m.47445 type:complete len:81 (-) Transcript_15982:767-1009(-)
MAHAHARVWHLTMNTCSLVQRTCLWRKQARLPKLLACSNSTSKCVLSQRSAVMELCIFACLSATVAEWDGYSSCPGQLSR